jgi:hypothetical protein
MKFWKVMSAIMDVLVIAAMYMAGCQLLTYLYDPYLDEEGAIQGNICFENSSFDSFLCGIAYNYRQFIEGTLRASGTSEGITSAVVAVSAFIVILIFAVIIWAITLIKTSSYEEGIATGAISYRRHHHHHGHEHDLGTVVSSADTTSSGSDTTSSDESTSEGTTMSIKEKIAARKAAKAAKKAAKAAAKTAPAAAEKPAATKAAGSKPETINDLLKKL